MASASKIPIGTFRPPSLLRMLERDNAPIAKKYMQQNGYHKRDVMGRTLVHLSLSWDSKATKLFYQLILELEPITWENISTHILNQKDNTDLQSTPLHRAVAEGRHAHVQALCDCRVSAIAQDRFKRIPLHLAAMLGNGEIIKCLLELQDTRGVKDSLERIPSYYTQCTAEERRERLRPYIGDAVDALKFDSADKVKIPILEKKQSQKRMLINGLPD